MIEDFYEQVQLFDMGVVPVVEALEEERLQCRYEVQAHKAK